MHSPLQAELAIRTRFATKSNLRREERKSSACHTTLDFRREVRPSNQAPAVFQTRRSLNGNTSNGAGRNRPRSHKNNVYLENALTADASSSFTSNTVYSLVICSRSCTFLVRFSSFSSPP